MTGHMLKRGAAGLLLCLLLLALSLLSGKPVFALAALVLPMLSLLSLLLNLITRRHIRFHLEAPGMSEKGKPLPWSLKAENSSQLPCGPLVCQLTIGNGLTGETSRQWLTVTANPRCEGQADGSLSSVHCGYLTLRISRARITDWFGFLSLPIRTEASVGCLVLPDTFDTHVSLEIPPLGPEDEEEYSPDKSGYDYSETFQLRDYQEGDSLKQLHWKLSEKLDKPISRDPSLPVSRSLLILWEKNAASQPAEMDAMAEAAASLCQELSRQGLAYALGWHDSRGLTISEIRQENRLLELIPEMLKYGSRSDMPDLQEAFDGSFGFAKTILIAGELPEVPFGDSGCVTALLCAGKPADNCPCLCFQPDSLEEDLNTLLL